MIPDISEQRKSHLDCVTVEQLVEELKKIEDTHNKWLNRYDYETMSNPYCDTISRSSNKVVQEHRQRCFQDYQYLYQRLQRLKKREAACYFCLNFFPCLKYFSNVDLAQKECQSIEKKLQALKLSAESLSFRVLFTPVMN